MAEFKSPSLKLTNTNQDVYTSGPTGAVIIGFLASHNGASEDVYELTVTITRGSDVINVLGKGSQVFTKTSLSLGGNKIVLQPGDVLKAYAEATNGGTVPSVDLVVSLMEF